MKNSFTAVSELKKLRNDGELSKEDYHEKIVDTFLKSLSFDFSKVIGKGSFSTVLQVLNENAREGFALRIVLIEDLGPKEREWKSLRHENLLSLFFSEEKFGFDVAWFLCPVVEMTLESVLNGKILQNKSTAFNLCVSWIKEITSALDYLHKKEVSFMNLKPSNVMICSDQKVKLFGFHRLNKIDQLITGYDLPYEFYPPETFSVDGRQLPVEGRQFDMWCLSILTIEVFTGMYLKRNVSSDVYSWSDNVYPVIFEVLKKNNFNKECRTAFPKCSIKDKMLKRVRNFSRRCLRLLPIFQTCEKCNDVIILDSRPSAAVLLRSKLFDNKGEMFEKDGIWKKQLSPTAMKQKIKNLNILFQTDGAAILAAIKDKERIGEIEINGPSDDNANNEPKIQDIENFDDGDTVSIDERCAEKSKANDHELDNVSIDEKHSDCDNKKDDFDGLGMYGKKCAVENVHSKSNESHSSRLNSFGYKIASKMFHFFI